jgi:hypothetical protein
MKKANNKIICPESLKVITKQGEILSEVYINFTTGPLFISGQWSFQVEVFELLNPLAPELSFKF